MLAAKKLNSKSAIFNRIVRLMGNRFEISVVANNAGWGRRQDGKRHC